MPLEKPNETIDTRIAPPTSDSVNISTIRERSWLVLIEPVSMTTSAASRTLWIVARSPAIDSASVAPGKGCRRRLPS